MFRWAPVVRYSGAGAISDDRTDGRSRRCEAHMFYSPGLEQLDPALLAFVKCHGTSPVKWEVLRVLAGQDGTWSRADQLARQCHRHTAEIMLALAELASDGVVDVLDA